jgi:hypothetical protein
MKPSNRLEYYQIINKKNQDILKKEYFITQVRKEELPLWTIDKYIKNKKVVQFQKENSVFKPWIEDNPKIIKKCIDYDLQYWRVPKFGKFKDDPQDYKDVVSTIKENYEMLKHIFLNIASESYYPCMGQTDLSSFCRQVGILDETIPTATIDRKFIETKVVVMPGAPGNLLSRNDFLDVLVRIARAKYFDTGRVSTINESLKLVL